MSRRVVDLNGDDWRLGQAPGAAPGRATWHELGQVENWLPARVPGNVRADLIRAGYLPELLVGDGPQGAQWVDRHSWWLVREFPHPGPPGSRVYLILRGIDYISDLFVNERYLGRHEGMFSPQIHDITHLLGAENKLAVRLLGSAWLPRDRSSLWEKLLNRLESALGSMPGRFPDRRDTVKCQMGFGWDFSPPLRTMGIWDDVYMIVTGGVFVGDLVVRQRVTGETAIIGADVRLDAKDARGATARLTLAGETFESEPMIVEQAIALPAGASRHPLRLAVPNPKLWWPWDHGRPDLYRLTVEILDGDRLLDSATQAVGLRSVAMEDWAPFVNGRKIFVRGANWVPAHILPGQVTKSEYKALLTLARQANMNMLRVWGGGLREKRAFYELCDQMGILIWQEFPIACAFLTRYPHSKEFLEVARREATGIVRDLRRHPSLALWCGGNEFSPRRNKELVAILRQVVAQEDPTRPFLSASPADGDSHNWQVWHKYHPPAAYRKDKAAFASEFGLQAPPDPASLARFIPKSELWPPGPSWTYHGADLEKLERYAQPFLSGMETSLEGFVRASQDAQAHGLQIAIEHYRRRKSEGCGGVLVWQLNEPWPAISWALIDFYLQPKPAYEVVRRLFSPVFLSIEYPLRLYRTGDRFCARVWVVNDKAEALPDCYMEIVLLDEATKSVCRSEQFLDVPPDFAGTVASLNWQIPPGSNWCLTCRLVQAGRTLAENKYNLTVHDSIQPALRRRLRDGLAGLVLPP